MRHWPGVVEKCRYVTAWWRERKAAICVKLQMQCSPDKLLCVLQAVHNKLHNGWQRVMISNLIKHIYSTLQKYKIGGNLLYFSFPRVFFTTASLHLFHAFPVMWSPGISKCNDNWAAFPNFGTYYFSWTCGFQRVVMLQIYHDLIGHKYQLL